MKTKVEIINETAANYTLNNRSISDGGRCLYQGPNGERCALARCMMEPITVKEDLIVHTTQDSKYGCMEVYGNHPFEDELVPLDTLLKEEYRGHIPEFWVDIQTLHDSSWNWTAEGLSDEGKETVQELLEKYQ